MSVRNLLAGKAGGVATIEPTATIAEAVESLAARKIGALVVTGPGQMVAGILSERDIVRLLGSKGSSALTELVGSVMTRKVITCTENDSVHDIMEQMTAGKFRHVPVVDKGMLAGIVSIGDVVKHRLEEMEKESAALRDYIMSA